MTTHVLIGVGGTGAKVVEAALYMFLAGIGPRKVIVGLVDQDKSNGNVNRTKKLINDIALFRQDFGGSKDNRLDWETDGDAGGCWLGSVDVQPLMDGDPHWRPSEDGPRSLADILGRSNMEKEPGLVELFDVLFEPGKTEQDMSLAEGYRGRAHIGSAAMLASLELGADGFKRKMEELIDQGGQNEQVRIFLVGSVFGGTGAAGFPTLSRALDAIREAKAQDDEFLRDQVRFGGALMLPYFGFDDPKDKAANVVKNNDLMPQARAALEYYHHLFEHEPVFDRFYVAGWEHFFRLGYHQAGATDQINPALPPELLGALAAIDFFESNLGPRKQSVPVMVSARGDAGELNWTDVPVETATRHQVYDRLGRLMRLALYWRYEVEPELKRRKEFLHSFQPWMQYLAKDVKWDAHTPEARKRLLDLLNDYLVWAGSMRITSQNTGQRLDFDLWDTSPAHDPAHQPTATKPVLILEAKRGTVDVPSAFGGILPALDPQHALRGSDRVVADLNQKSSTAKNAGLGKMLAAVHRAARPIDLNS